MVKFDYFIIGNSAGAIGCIEGLRSVDKSGSIAVISEESYHVYSRALIPYFIEGKIAPENMDYRPKDFYRKAGVTLYTGERAEKINHAEKEVQLSSGDCLYYDKILLAVGGKPIIPPIPGLDKNNIYTFLSMDDAEKINNALPRAKNAVVLGGGVIGLMAAEVLHKKGLTVSVVELAERVLSPVVDETASDMIEETFKKNGAGVYTNNTVQEIHGGDTVESVTLQDGTVLPCDILIMGIGVKPRTELAEEAGMKVERGVVVNRKMQTSVPGVYACGDCASIYDFVAGENRPLPLWPNAYSGGRVAAYNMAGVDREYTWGTGMNSMHFFDLNIVNAGLNVTSEERETYQIINKLDKKNNVYRKFILNDKGAIAGFILVGEIDRAGIFLNLMRKENDVCGFSRMLLNKDFGYASLPEELRWELLKDDVILGVV